MQTISGNIYIEGQGIVRSSMTYSPDRILSFGEYSNENALPEKEIIVPGFIDKHIHGANGYDCMRDSYVASKVMAESLLKEGVTAFLPTTMTAPKENILLAVSEIARYKQEQESGAKILGIHLEGPFISPKKAGAQPKEDILKFDEKTFSDIQNASKGNLKQVTYAPEENVEMTKCLVDNNILASIGHTAGNCNDILKAEIEGARSATHVYNAMSGIGHRDCGALGGVFLSEKMWCELICDGKHVEKEGVRILYKAVKDRIVLVTDSTEAKYMPDGNYYLGKNKIKVANGIALLTDGVTIAGSVLKMNVAIKNMMDFCKIPLQEAIDMATINPAKALRLDKKMGSLAVGKRPDFAVITDNIDVLFTHVGNLSSF